MGFLSRFEGRMEDTFEGAADKMFDAPISPVQIAKKAEKQMRREKMVGAGKLIQLLFGLNYHVAVVLVGVLMVLYVLFGGMLATTWVQIIKAVLLLCGASFMAFMVMKHVGFSFNNLFTEAMAVHPKGAAIMSPGGLVKDPISALSLGLGLMFGTAGLPHILMRFFTVSDAKEARKSVFYATGFMGYFYILTFIIGFGAIMLVGANPAFKDAAGQLIGGNNMAAVHLADAVGGNLFLGFISAVAFATILAVVAGLTLAGASAVSHDLYANVFRKGATERQELKVSKITVLILGVVAILLGILFENQNIAFMVGLAFSIAASCNFPIILLSMYWSKLTTRGAMVGGWLYLRLSAGADRRAVPVRVVLSGIPAEAVMVIGYFLYEMGMEVAMGSNAAAAATAVAVGIPMNIVQGVAGVIVCAVLLPVLSLHKGIVTAKNG